MTTLSSPTSLPADGDYLTDGVRLLQVVTIDRGAVVVEDAATEAIERVDQLVQRLADGRLRPVVRAPLAA